MRTIIECLYCKKSCIRTWGLDGFGIRIVCHSCDNNLRGTCEICSFRDVVLYNRNYLTNCYGEFLHPYP